MGDVLGELFGACPRDPCRHGAPLAPADEVAASLAEVEAGDLVHAAHHLAVALACDPLRVEWQPALARLMRAAPDPLALFPVPAGSAYLGNHVGHACVLAHHADPGRALLHVVKACRARPEVTFMALAARWFETPQQLRRPRPAELVTALEAWIGPHVFARQPALAEGERRNLEAFRPALEHLLKLHPASAPLQALGSTYLRILGRTGMAVTVAQRAFQASMNGATALTLALAQHARKDHAAAVKSYKRVLELDPRCTGVEVALGDLHVLLDQPGGALAWYRKAQEDPTQELAAAPGVLAARWKQERAAAALDELRRLAQDDPPDARAREWLAHLGHALPDPVPFVDFLPEPEEATLKLLWKAVVAARGEVRGALVRWATEVLEPPSARLAFALAADKLGVQSTVRVMGVQAPDPRLAAAEVAHSLWAWDGLHPRPAVAPPSAGVAREVAEVARTPYALGRWAEATRALGERLGPAAIPDLLASLVHPPPGPDDLLPDRWLLRVQQAATLTLAQTEAGWEGTRRRAALHALVHGPSDWTVQAALVALGHLAATAPAVEAEAATWLAALIARVPRPGPCCWLRAAVAVGLRLPNLSPELRERLLQARAGEDAVQRPAPA